MPDLPKAPEQHSPAPAESPAMSMLSNVLAIVGFIILALIVVWGLFHIISLTTSSFNIGNPFASKPQVEVTMPKTAPAGQPLTITWKYNGSQTGSYSFLYQCKQGFSFATPSDSPVTIPCGASIDVGSSTAATVMPILSASSSEDVSVSVTFTSQDNSVHASGSASVTITPGSGAQKPATPSKPSATTTTTKPKSPSTATARPAAHLNLVAHAASGPADLSVRVIAIGTIDPASGALLSRMPSSPTDVAGIEFDIANVGGSPTGTWCFTAQLPTYAPYTYSSPSQISLKPGEHIVNVLRFTQSIPNGVVTIVADPQGQVVDANRANNTASTAI